MGFFDKITRIFKKKQSGQAIESASKRLNERSQALAIDLKRSKAIESAPNRLQSIESRSELPTLESYDSSDFNRKKYPRTSQIDFSEQKNNSNGVFTKVSMAEQENDNDYEIFQDRHLEKRNKLSDSVELQKESLQLGVAAGYTGKAIREIESSLNRLEINSPSKEWIETNLVSDTKRTVLMLNEIKRTLENHDISTVKRFQIIEDSLSRMMSVAKSAPEPIRNELIKEINSIDSSLPLTSKMEELISIVKRNGKISYDNLAESMGITRSGLRGLLSITLKRTTEIERYSVEGRGWVKYIFPKTSQLKEYI